MCPCLQGEDEGTQMNRIATLIQDMAADVAAALWLARHPASDRLAILFGR